MRKSLLMFVWVGMSLLRPSFLMGDSTNLPPGVVIDHVPASTGFCVSGPSIAVLANGDYVASHFVLPTFQNKNHTEADKKFMTYVFGSSDRGKTWRSLSEVKDVRASKLFVHRKTLYLIGRSNKYGPLTIQRSLDGGRTWTLPKDKRTGGMLCDGVSGFYNDNGQEPIIEHNGRLWRAVEPFDKGGKWGIGFLASMLSVPADADLLDTSMWTLSQLLPCDKTWLGGKFKGWLEGNPVVTPDGNLVSIMRVHKEQENKPPHTAAVVEVSADGKQVTFDPAKGFIDFPGGHSRFSIRHDAKTGFYWALVNSCGPRGCWQKYWRNALALTRSKDLRKWEVRCVLLSHPDSKNHAFQYPDWQFDGDDLITVLRTAYDDAAGGACRAHDANYLTFYRIAHFRDLTLADSAPVVDCSGKLEK